MSSNIATTEALRLICGWAQSKKDDATDNLSAPHAYPVQGGFVTFEAPMQTFLQYTNGGFCPLTVEAVPVWIRAAVLAHEQPGDELDHALSDAGSQCVERCGTALSVDVWKNGQTWFAQWYDDRTVYANVVITTLVDFLDFQANWLAPVVSKIMAEDRYFEWRQSLAV